VPDDSPLQTNYDIPWTSTQPAAPTHDVAPAKQPSIFLRWPFLILYAILIAILAGVGGGFIGSGMTTKRFSKDTLPRSELQGFCSSIQTPPNPTSPTPTSTPPSSASASPTLFQRTLPIPTTGCTPPTQQRSFKSVTKFLAAQYTTFCATGWLNDELFALSAATPSDCVEACVMYNGHKGSGERSCVGGGFIPEWWNQSRAMEESGGMPYNCFLKSNDSGTGRNEKNVEVVSLCLGGACGDVLGGS
tara:strand:- start:239 stop:976 length:738 start_codon:yes stop_codon:yes gene_type:complete